MARDSGVFAHEVFNQLHLYLLDLQYLLPLVEEKMVYLPVQLVNLHLGVQVNLVIVLGMQPVPRLLPVLAHDNKRGLDRSESREDEVEEDIGVRVERS